MSPWLALAALFGGLGVGLGAFGAHALKAVLSPDLLVIFETGVRYQMYHALVLLVLAFQIERYPALKLPAKGFMVGIVIFSGSLYTLALSGVRIWGAVTPLGGLAFIFSWLSLIWLGLKQTQSE